MQYSYDYGYDETSPSSIEQYAKRLIGKTFQEVCDMDSDNTSIIKEDTAKYNERHDNRRHKGGLGEIIEERFFHYKCNNDAKPDFDKAGVELKVTPYRINKNGSLSAKERLIITMIDFNKVIYEPFEQSHFWKKARLILLIFYLYKQEIKQRLGYRIDYVKLFSPPEQDILIIKNDYEKIIQKIKEGKAHELSEGDTLYLGAAPKAATSSVRRTQPYSEISAKPRAFAFKNSYLTYILNTYVVPGRITYEPIVKDKIVASFEDYVIEKLNYYRGFSVEDLCIEFDVEYQRPPKNLGAMLAFRILGVKGNNAEEFEKAGIKVKTIRITNKNTIRESMSFPVFKFKELIKEEWDTSTFRTYLSETRFLFVVFKYDDNGVLRLKGCQFWNIPYKDLNEEVYSVWERTRQVIINGLEIYEKNGVKTNNFPKTSENRVCHVRPHAINANDTYELPDGREFPKQCFWLSNIYIQSQLNKEFFA